jgi:guanine deaminase
MNDTGFMAMAIEEARSGIESGHGGPFGAVVVCDGEVLARAHNRVLTDNDPTRHAEINAISLASVKRGTYDLSGCVLYSTTEPCPMCFAAIHWARMKRVVYGTDISDVRRLGFNELTIPCAWMKDKGGSSVEVVGDFMRPECGAVLDEWEAMSGKEVY